MNLSDLASRLARLDLDAVAGAALAAEASRIAEAVREALGHAPGAAAHLYPWKQSGTLQASIAVSADGAQAVIGSADPVAIWQEHGTPRIPPRPFLAPVAQENAAAAAGGIAAAVAAAVGAA